MKRAMAVLLAVAVTCPLVADEIPPGFNLLLNPALEFHCFANSRQGTAACFSSGAVPCWDQDAYDDAVVYRSTRQNVFRPSLPVDNVVCLRPGKRLSQFALLSELGLDHGDEISLSVQVHQSGSESLQASVHMMRIDSDEGEFGIPGDPRTFPRHARGELIRAPGSQAVSGMEADGRIVVEGVRVVGGFTESADRSRDDANTIGIEIEFVNRSKEEDVWIYAPCLCRGPRAHDGLPAARPRPSHYRGIPRTIQKLWRGEPLHVIVMGSSIDRGSANPSMRLYDEDPESPAFKELLVPEKAFSGDRVGRPEWNDFIAWWQHHFMYGGRLRQALMRKYDMPIDRLLLNTMACDGSSISESHSALEAYASLAIPPDPHANGHRAGRTWRELYPSLFQRPEGPRPDLVIFGSGANEHIDGPAEIAAFEGAIRWFQRRYPHTEFLFCMWQNREAYTPNTGHLMELSLRYQIPFIDLGRLLSLTTRHCNSYALCPRDGHPQAAAHLIWAKQWERAFDVADPIEPGIAQLQLPERVHPATLGWEGDATTYLAGNPRIRRGTGFILDDIVVNMWADGTDDVVGIRLDGAAHDGSRRQPMKSRDLRNSSFAIGNLSLGDRHVIEVDGTGAAIVAIDAKTVPERQWAGVEVPRWSLGGLRHEAFASEWGGPFGSSCVIVPAGQTIGIDLPGTLFAVAYVDRPDGGTLTVEVNGQASLRQPTNAAFTTAADEKVFMENRKALPSLPFGVHMIRLTAVDRPVTVLGVFAYDTRPSKSGERVLRGMAAPGETIRFVPPFAARPLVLCTGGLSCPAAAADASAVRFEGQGPGGYEIIGH
jgi:hypothetical protein